MSGGFLAGLRERAYGVAFLLVAVLGVAASVATFEKVFTQVVTVTLRTDAQTRVQPGDKVGLAVAPANAHWFDAKTENRLA